MKETVRSYEVQIKGVDSVKSLKQEISDLRDKLVTLDSSTKEYSDTVDELIADEKKLKEVMTAGKDAVTGATGSYNALVNEMGALKKVWREVSDEGKRSQIGKRIGEINDELKRLDSSIGNNQRNVGNYEAAFKQALMTPQQELKKLKVELAGLEEGTEAYNQTFQRMAQLTHDVTEQTEQLKWSSADLGDILGNIAGVAQGVAGGFSAISAIQGLIGSGNEDVEKALLTTQRWIQLIQGLGALEELGDKVKGLWTGLKTLASATEDSSDNLDDLKDDAKKAKASLQEVTTAANGTQQSLNNVATSAKSAGAGLATVGTNTKATTTLMGGLRTMLGSVATGAKALGVALKGALISSGIGAAIMATTYALTKAYEMFKKWKNGADDAQRAFGDFIFEIDLYTEQLRLKQKWNEREIELHKLQGATDEQIVELKKKHNEVLKEETIAFIDNLEVQLKNFKVTKDTKEQYDKMVDSLNELKKTKERFVETSYDLAYEEYVYLPEKRKVEALEKQGELYKENQKKAEELYKELQEYYKTDTKELEEKLKEELSIIDKWNVDSETKTKVKQLALIKYKDELLKSDLESVSNIYALFRENVSDELEILGIETEKGFQAQLEELARFKAAIEGTLFSIENGKDVAGELKWFNAFEGTDIKNLKGLELALDGVNKKIFELINTKSLEKYNSQLQTLSNEAQNASISADLELEKKASESTFGYYEGISPSDLRKNFEERYAIQEEFLNKEIELYKKASEDKTLTDQQREEFLGLYHQRMIDKEHLLTEKIIESNNMQIESFKIVSESIMGITESLGDILGTIGDTMMDNVEAQREAGKISQKEYERQFEKAKSFQVAQAIINTISGAVGAFMGITKDTGGWGIALAIAQATAVFASGMAQVKKIRDTEPTKGSSSTTGEKFAEVTPSATSDYRPEMITNPTGGQESENLANAISGMNLWVSVSEIDNAQAKGKVRVAESSF